MGKTRSFLGVFALLLTAVFATNSFAAGYTCDTKTYISCNADYFLSGTGTGNSCKACPGNSYTNSGNSATSCTCDTGYTTDGTPGGGTTTASADCAAIKTTITLNLNGGTTNGTTALYATYGAGVYTDSARTKSMTTTANGFTAPAKQYTVTYNVNGGSLDTTSAVSGATFNGFYSLTTGGTKYTGTQYILDAGLTAGKGYTSDTTWYAQWGTQSAVTLPTPVRTGHTFNGWYTSATGGTKAGDAGASYTPSANTTLYAQWSAISYTCAGGEYLPKGATGCASCKAGYYCTGGTYSYNANADQGLTGVCASGYSTGGASKSTCTPCTSGYSATGTAAADHDKKSDCEISITLNKNGGSGTVTTSVTCLEGESCNFGSAAALTQNGYKFTGGWGTSTSCDDATTSFNTPTNTTYYACKTANTYKVAYNKNASSATGSMSDQSFVYGTVQNLTANGFTNPGLNFQGWATSSGGAVAYSDGQLVSNLTTEDNGVFTLYAVWGNATTYTITYELNGGTNNASNPATYTVEDSVTFATPSKTGYTFDGWYKESTFNTKTTGISAGTTGNQTVYAKWTINSYKCESGEYLAAGATVCATCPAKSYCTGGTYTYNTDKDQGKTGCPTNYPNSANGAKAITECYSNTKQRTWSGKQVNGTTPTNCASVTAWNSCSIDACDYVAYSNASGSGDGTVKSGCATNNADCTKTVKSVTANANSYVDGATCKVCPSDYPKSDGGDITSDACYIVRTNTGSEVAPSLPTGCTSQTVNSCEKPTCEYKDYAGQSGESCTPGTCNQTHKSCTSAKTNYYLDSGVAKSCPSDYPSSAGGNVTSDACYGTFSKSGVQKNGSVPANCASVTEWTACTPGTCEYTKYQSGAIKTDCTPSDCTKTVKAVTANANSYVDGTTCKVCPTSYPSSAGGDISDAYCYTTCGSKTGYTLSSGYDYKGTTDTCAYAANKYTVTYSCGVGSGTAPSAGTATYDANFTPASNTCTAPAGYKFSTWTDGTTNRAASTAFKWQYTEDKTFTAVYVVEGATDITYNTNGGTIQGSYTMACNASTPAFDLPTNVVRVGYEFAGWKNAAGATVKSVAQGECTSALVFDAQWTPCTDTTDGACGCAAGTHPDAGTCVSCVTQCSTLGSEYQGTYNVCENDASTQCYTTCEAECVEPSSCPSNFLRCKYLAGEIIVGKKYYGSDTCAVDSNACPIDLSNSQTYCSSGYYLSKEYPDCSATCSSLEPKGSYYYSISATLSKGPNACYDQCVPTCNYANDYILGTDGKVTGETVNHCPEHATCTEGTLPAQGYRWYPQTVCTPTAFCSFTFVCDPGYVANTTKAISYGYKKTLYGSPMTASDIATCTPGTYAITLDDNMGNGGTGVVYQKYTIGWYSDNAATDTVNNVVKPARTGYTFKGYYTAASGGTQVIGTDGALPANNTYTADTTLYAQWQVNHYDITYNMNGGTNNGQNPASYTIEETPIALATPTKTGYTFAGWYSDSNFANKVTEIATGSTGNKTFWAKWAVVSYDITYNLNGGVNNSANPDTYTIEETPITLATPTKTGYTFAGWYSDSNFANKVTEIATGSTGNKTYWAKWAVVTYSITYNMNGGVNNSANPDTYTIEETPITLATPTKTGYTFAGWYSDSNFVNKVTEIATGSTGNKTYWAKWSVVTYNITYNLNGGTNNEQNPTSYTIEETPFDLEIPTKTGYSFTKWTNASGETVTKIAAGTTGDIELTANWSSNTYQITYDVVGGTNNSKNPSEYSVDKTPITLADPTKTGYIFDGWTGDNIANNQIVKGTVGDVTAKANWIATKFTVHFDPTDATGVTVPNVTCTYDQDCTAAAAPTMDYKTFNGWNTQADGNGTSVAAGGSIKNLVSNGGTITLYAIWDQNMVACKPGYYFDNGTETQCVSGQYCPGIGEINEGSTGCIETCPAGGATVTSGADSINECRKTAVAGDIEFKFGTALWDCAYTSGTGSSAVYRTDCDAIALTCDAGYYYTGNGAIACTTVADGYYSPAPTTSGEVKDELSMSAIACPNESGSENDGIGSVQPRSAITNCYSACALTIADVPNSKTVTPNEERAFSTTSGTYPACSYTIACNPGYTAKNGTAPECIANEYPVILDKNNGTGNVAESIECVFNSGKCDLPSMDTLVRPGYVSAGKWCTNADGTGTCYTAGATTTKNISDTGTEIKLFAAWTPGVFKVELIANDATVNAAQSPVYLKYTRGWYSDKNAENAITSIDTSALPSKPGYNFAGYSVGDVMIVNASGVMQTTDTALVVTTENTTANVVWAEGDTTCEPGYYYAGNGGECTVCAVDHWCPGGTFPTDTGVVGGHEICPESGISEGGENATNIGVCYKHGLDYTSTTGKASGTQTCNYDGVNKSYSASCRSHSVKTCVAGYYYVSGIDCVEVGINHYSVEGSLKREACPADGLTGTLKTSGSAADCYKTVEYIATYGNGTQVCNYTSLNDDGSAKYATNCRDKYITACQGGYYRENAEAIDCVKVGFDAYSEDGSLERVPCPDGGDTDIETAAASTMCYKAENPFTSDHGSGVRYCRYTPETGDYTVCGDKMFRQCDAGYYWAAYGDADCTVVDYGFFGPVADAGNEGYLTARQACATYNGQPGQTDTEASADASACFMVDIPCGTTNATGSKTCEYDISDENYSANCTVCAINACAEKYYLSDNECLLCPAGSICDENTGKDTDGDGIPDNLPQSCADLFNGRYPNSDAGSTSTDQCYGSCDLLNNVATMIGRNYAGDTIADTCEIETCEDSYYLATDKSECVLCPEGSICDTNSGADLDGDGIPDNTPKTCKELTNGTHEFAAAGSTMIEQCYAKCEDYEILGGMAIRNYDTVYYDDVCTYKGVSETGNPCEIKTISGAETCIETSCNPDYELIDGRCKKCDRENATAYKPNGNCLVAKCHTGYHPSGDKCEEDIKTCAAPNALEATQVWDTKLGAFGICQITECESGYHVASNACVPDTEVCDIENGTGVREWDYKHNRWGECVATSCDAGYTNDAYESDEPAKQCGRCRNAKSVLGQDAVSAYSRGCEIAACLYQGELYNLENNECVPICPTTQYEDETGTMKWNPKTKKCERECYDGYMSW